MTNLDKAIQMMRESKMFSEEELIEFRMLIATEDGRRAIIEIINESIQDDLRKKVNNLLDKVNKI